MAVNAAVPAFAISGAAECCTVNAGDFDGAQSMASLIGVQSKTASGQTDNAEESN